MASKFSFVDLGIKIGSNLIIADLHLGYESALSKGGVLVPRFHIKDILHRLDVMIKRSRPKRVIINGDIKHEFGMISEQEWKDTLKLIDWIMEKAEISIIRGNHDRKLEYILQKRNLKLEEDVIIDGFFLTHGDVLKEIPKGCHTIIIGHEHPTVSIREASRIERFKCFIEGKYKKKRLLVLPSFNLVVEGHDLIVESPISPYLKKSIDESVVYVIPEPGKILNFGKLVNIKEM